MVLTVHLTVYHNEQSRFGRYADGQHLHAVTSHVLTGNAADPTDRLIDDAATWAWHTFNADLHMLEDDRVDLGGETTFLAACTYRLRGLRSLSFPRDRLCYPCSCCRRPTRVLHLNSAFGPLRYGSWT